MKTARNTISDDLAILVNSGLNTVEQLERVRAEKAEKCGIFKDKLLLKEVVEDEKQ